MNTAKLTSEHGEAFLPEAEEQVCLANKTNPTMLEMTQTWQLSTVAYLCAGLDDKVIHRKLLAVLGKALVQLTAQLDKLVHSAVHGEVIVRDGLLGLQQPLSCDAADLAVGNVLVVTVVIRTILQTIQDWSSLLTTNKLV